jgi:hypothetical protein
MSLRGFGSFPADPVDADALMSGQLGAVFLRADEKARMG